jgi:hypothetical protein
MWTEWTEWGREVGSHELGNEPSGSIKFWLYPEYIDSSRRTLLYGVSQLILLRHSRGGMRYLPVVMRLECLQSGRLPGLRELYREESHRMGRAHFDFRRRKPENEIIRCYRPQRAVCYFTKVWECVLHPTVIAIATKGWSGFSKNQNKKSLRSGKK